MVDPVQVAQFAVNGIVLGSVLTLTAVGLTLVYGILDLANFAHGDLVTMGAYLGLFFSALLAPGTLTAWTGAVVLVAVGAAAWERGVRPRLGGPVRARLSPAEATGLGFVALLVGALYAAWRQPVDVGGALWSPLLSAGVAAVLALRAVQRDPSARDPLLAAVAGGVAVAVGGAALAMAGLPAPTATWLGPLAALPVVAVALRRHGTPLGDPATGGPLALAVLAGAYLGGGRLLLAVVLAIVVAAAVTVAADLVIWRPMRRRDAGLLTLIIISIGLALMLRNIIRIRFGTSVRSWGPTRRARPILGSPVTATPNELLVVGITAVAIVLVHALLRYTKMGKAMRALSDDVDLARVAGIDVDRVILYVWIIAAALATLGGVLLGQIRVIHPSVGWFLLLPIFSAVILGGIGSAYGAMAGGYVIGIAMEVSPAFGVPNEYKLAVGFAAMILTLLLRPEGIAGGSGG